jgi:Mrp family chromosome partitioning ATPase/capsular polysaccharide biosynthesis protein
MTDKETDGLSIGAYLRVLLRWKWVVIVVTLAVTILGTAYTWTRTPMYSATSTLLYVTQIDIADPLGTTYVDKTAQQAEIESVPTVINSARVQESAQALMEPANVESGYGVSATLQPGLSNDYSNIIGITGTSAKPEAAADAANSYAQAFVEWNRESARAQVADAIAVVEERMDGFTTESQRQSNQYLSLQQRLQDLQLLEAATQSSFKVITPAGTPSTPYEPNKPRGIVLALAVGLVLGVALAFLFEQFDTRVRGEDQVVEALGLPIIAHVPPLSRRGHGGSVLQMLADPAGPAAESYRVLRSNLEFTAVDEPVHTLLVSSSLQGEGKSVISCNLAVSMALAGKRVVLVDADLRGPHVHSYMGIPNARGVSTLMARRDSIKDALVPVALDASQARNGSIVMTAQAAGDVKRVKMGVTAADHAGDWLWPDSDQGAPVLSVLPSGPVPPNPGEIVASRRFADILESLAKDADIVIVDAPAMLPVGDTAALAPHVDALAYVANPDLLRRPNLEQARVQLSHLPCRILGLVIVAHKRGRGYYGYYAADGVSTSSRRRAPTRA